MNMIRNWIFILNQIHHSNNESGPINIPNLTASRAVDAENVHLTSFHILPRRIEMIASRVS
jgi:hypothetical protein